MLPSSWKIIQYVGLFGLMSMTVLAKKSDTFNLIAIGEDVNSVIQLYPLSIVDGAMVVSREGDRLKYQIDDDGKVTVQDTDYRLIIDSHNHLTANTSGTTIFYIAGAHLHYNDKFVFVGCPKGDKNETFAAYASTNTAICDNSVLFTLRPQRNATDDISSYIPSVLDSRTGGFSGTAVPSGDSSTLENGIRSVTLTKDSSSGQSTSTGNSNVVLETINLSTVTSTSNDDNVVTETIIIENQQSFTSQGSVFTSTVTNAGGNDNVVTITTEVSPSTADSGDDDTIVMPSSNQPKHATVIARTVCKESQCATVKITTTTVVGDSLATLATETLPTTSVTGPAALLSSLEASSLINYLSGLDGSSSLQPTGSASSTLLGTNRTRTSNFAASIDLTNPFIMLVGLLPLLAI